MKPTVALVGFIIVQIDFLLRLLEKLKYIYYKNISKYSPQIKKIDDRI